jgi:hypothetical protein
MVDKAFLKFDKLGDGFVYIDDLQTCYNTEFHPKVISGEMTKEQVFMELMSNFGEKKQVLSKRVNLFGLKNRNGAITIQQSAPALIMIITLLS